MAQWHKMSSFKAVTCLSMILAVGRHEAQGQGNSGAGEGFNLRRAREALVVLGDHVYFEGGMESGFINEEDAPGGREANPINSTRYIALTESWESDSVEFVSIERNNDGPRPLNNVVLWPDEDANKFYRWGGVSRYDELEEDEETHLWIFTPGDDGGGEWSIDERSEEAFDDIRGLLEGSWTTCDGRGHFVGGFGNNRTDRRFESIDNEAVSGMLSYEMSNGGWDHDSAEPLNSPDGTHVRGQALCLTDFGEEALVVVLGGQDVPLDNAYNEVLRDMDDVAFFTSSRKDWYHQPSWSSIAPPEDRETFCAVGVRSPEGTFEIFVYGGRTSGDAILDDIWILSLPAFRWFQVEVESPPRFEHACAVVGNRQMLVSGGFDEVLGWDVSDPWEQALGVFDLTELRWKDEYDADAEEYQMPSVVRDFYENGGMDDVGWISDEVESLFRTDSPFLNPPNEAESTKSPPVGAIVGGVVGGLAAITLVAGGFWYYRRRNGFREAAASDDGSIKPPPYYSPQPAELPHQYMSHEFPGDGMSHELPSREHPNARYEMS